MNPGFFSFGVFMGFLWKWVHRKEPLTKPGKYYREGMEIEITEKEDKECEEMADRILDDNARKR